MDRHGRLQSARPWLATQRVRPAERIARSYRLKQKMEAMNLSATAMRTTRHEAASGNWIRASYVPAISTTQLIISKSEVGDNSAPITVSG